MSTLWYPALAACGLVLGTSAAAESPSHRTRVLKVFLADFDDVPHPQSYSPEYFRKLFFGLGEPRETPDGRAIAGSVREYFLEASEGALDTEGEVVDWVRIHRKITEVPHWKGGMEPFGESWPIIVAETLRANGIVGEGAREKLRLSDGRMPELLVFLNTDWGVGGCNRGWGHLKEVLGKMNLAALWDDAWAGFPGQLSSFSATIWRKAPGSQKDGTIDQIPPAAELELFPLSIMMHEMGHQLADLPDLYGPAYQPWGVFELMGGPAASTHFSMGLSAFLREQAGWMRYDDLRKETRHDLTLWPLATHKQAFRLPQGPRQETLVVENRARLEYPRDYGEPPVDKGPRLLLYRVDLAGRRRVLSGNTACRKITTMIRRPESYGEVWGEGAFAEITADTEPSSRNSLGELWWEFRNMRPGTEGDMQFDADLRAVDLVQRFAQATWTNGAGKQLPPGRLSEQEGDVSLRTASAQADESARVLHCRTSRGGSTTGRYAVPASPHRLYATVALSEGSEGAVVEVGGGGGGAASLVLTKEHPRQLLVSDSSDESDTSDQVDLTVRSTGGNSTAEVDVLSAWLVGLPACATDLVAAEPGFSWRAGPGGAAVRTDMALHDGGYYGPAVLALPMSGNGARAWTGTQVLTVPKEARVLRALFGFAAGATPGTAALVSLTVIRGEREWNLMRDLDLEVYPADADSAGGFRSNLLAVVEATLPREVIGREAIVQLEVRTESAAPFVFAAPVLRLCCG